MSKSLTVNLGGIYYAYDKVLYPQGDSFEIYYGLSADFEIVQIMHHGQ